MTDLFGIEQPMKKEKREDSPAKAYNYRDCDSVEECCANCKNNKKGNPYYGQKPHCNVMKKQVCNVNICDKYKR